MPPCVSHAKGFLLYASASVRPIARPIVPLGLMLLVCSCRCESGVSQTRPAALVVTPTSLVLAPSFIGQPTFGDLHVVNEGGRELTAVSVDAPFTIDDTVLDLAAGEEAVVRVHFTATQVGPASGVVTLGALTVPVAAEGLERPVCMAPSVCVDTRFDDTAAQCLETRKADGTTSASPCRGSERRRRLRRVVDESANRRHNRIGPKR